MIADKFKTPRTRLYSVRVEFPNANADYTTSVRAGNAWGAYWLAQCTLNDKSAKARRDGFPIECGSVSHINGKPVYRL